MATKVSAKEEALKHEPKYCITFSEDGHLEYIFIIQEIHNDVYVLEAVDWMWFEIYGKAEPPKHPINFEKIYEIKLSDLSNPQLCYSWGTVIQAVIADIKDERERR